MEHSYSFFKYRANQSNKMYSAVIIIKWTNLHNTHLECQKFRWNKGNSQTKKKKISPAKIIIYLQSFKLRDFWSNSLMGMFGIPRYLVQETLVFFSYAVFCRNWHVQLKNSNLILEKQIKLDKFLELFFRQPQCSESLDVVRLTLTFKVGDKFFWPSLPHG